MANTARAEIGSYEAKTHLPRLLDEVEAGASYTITKHGRPVARLVPVSKVRRSPEEVRAAFARLRDLAGPQTVSIAEARAEGRR